MNEHISEAMRVRMHVLTPDHLIEAGRALVARLRRLHAAYAEREGDQDRFVAAHTRSSEALANIIAVLGADEKCRDAAIELHAGLAMAIDSMKTQGFPKNGHR